MAAFVLIHGAGDAGWYWHLTEAELQARGHRTLAPDLPCDNDTASLDDYAGTVAGAVGGRPELVIVGPVLRRVHRDVGGRPAHRAAARAARRNDPRPRRDPGQWWSNTGYRQAVEEQASLDGGKTGHDDPLISFYNGVPLPLAEQAMHRGGRGESSAV